MFFYQVWVRLIFPKGGDKIMIKAIESIILFSENAKRLAKFYRETVGLKQTLEAEMGENNEELFGFKIGKGPGLSIMDHSKVKGTNKNPERIIVNLEVDDIKKEAKRLTAAKAKKVQDIYHVEGYGYIATFADVDGNFFQLVQVRAK